MVFIFVNFFVSGDLVLYLQGIVGYLLYMLFNGFFCFIGFWLYNEGLFFVFFLYGFVIKCWIKFVILVVLLVYVVKIFDKKIVIYVCILIIL